MYLGYPTQVTPKQCVLARGEGDKRAQQHSLEQGRALLFYTGTKLCCFAGVLCFSQNVNSSAFISVFLDPSWEISCSAVGMSSKDIISLHCNSCYNKHNENPPGSMVMVLKVIAALILSLSARPVVSTTASGDFFPLEKLPKGKCPVCKIEIFHGEMLILSIFLPFCL